MDAGILMELELSDEFRDEFKLDEVLGRGGMGVVYKAFQKKLNDRPVAIKFLREDYAQQDPVALQRFIDEGKICSTLNHPNVVQLYLYGRDNMLYLVYEFVEGQSLEDLLENTPRGHLSVQDGVELAIQICRGLGHAHEKGVVHRDIKPANILVEKATNTAKLTDFGIARNPLTGARTKTGIVVGTPAYMAPEQCRGDKNLDSSTDVYAVCVMIYEMLSGRLPYPGQGIELVRHHVDPKCKPIHLSQVCPTVPQSVASIIHRGLEKERSQRWRDGNELADALEQTLKGVAIGATSELATSGKRGPQRTRATMRAKAAGATVRQPSMSKSAKQRTSVQKPLSSMAVSAIKPPDERQPFIFGVLAAIVLAGAICCWFLLAGGQSEILEVSLKLADKNLTVAWRTNVETYGKLEEVKGLTGWKLIDDGGRKSGLLHRATGSFERVDSNTIEFVVSSADGKSLIFIFPMISLSLNVDSMKSIQGADWSFDRPITLQVPGKVPEHFDLSKKVNEIIRNFSIEDGLILPVLTGTCRVERGTKSVVIEFDNFGFDCLSNPCSNMAYPFATKKKDEFLKAKSEADEFMTLFTNLKVMDPMMTLLKEKIGPAPGPELPKVKSNKWKETLRLLEAFIGRRYQRGISLSLLNPTIPLEKRRKLKRAVEVLQMMLNRMASQCLDDDKRTFWEPGSAPWKKIHRDKPELYGERADTDGFWVPTVFLKEALEPLIYVERKGTKPERWKQRVIRKLSTKQPSLGKSAEKLLPSVNLNREYSYKTGGAGFMPGHEVPFKDLKEDFIKRLPGKRVIELAGHPKSSRIALVFSTCHFDVASTLRLTIGDEEIYLFANRSNDFNETQIQYKGVCSQFKKQEFDPCHQYLCEEPIHWFVDFPVAWLSGKAPLITVESFCLGLPLRIGKNSRSFGSLVPSARTLLTFINMTVLSEIECYEVKK